MAKWTILRVYEVPADTTYEAIDMLREAIALHVEQDYHVKDILRAPDELSGKGPQVHLDPPRGWLTAVIDQLLSRPEKTKR